MLIFDIQKCSIHDGNGLRTLVFFKGCPLHCPWCSNPESQSYKPEIMVSAVRCIGCGECARICPMDAIKIDGTIDRDKCNNCFKCVDVCYAESRRITGKEYTADELYKEIVKDKGFYSMFGGGVTFSGGEPLTHAKDLAEIAQKCHENGINVVLESCGYGNYDEFKEVLPYVDSMFMDIKIFDATRHKEVTGKSNELILENIRKISELGIPIVIRTPVIPGYTDTLENIKLIADFITTLPTVKEYELLQYHNFGESKYRALGRCYELEDAVPPTDDEMRAFVKAANDILKEYKKECYWTKNNNREVIL